MRLKILSYNIHKGFTLGNREFILEGIRAALRLMDPDIIFLQEVLGDHQHNKIHIPDWNTQFEYIADTYWFHHAYGKNAVYSEGHHGNAILSKYPIREWSNHTISQAPRELRGLLKAKIYIPEMDQEILLGNTHLDLTQRGRYAQTRQVIELMKNENLPWILVGDFNDWNQKISPSIEISLQAKEAFKELHRKYPATFPSIFPVLTLDRIFCKKMVPIKAQTLQEKHWKKLSDHLPLYAELDVNQKN